MISTVSALPTLTKAARHTGYPSTPSQNKTQQVINNSNVRNDFDNGGTCQDVMIVFAKGKPLLPVKGKVRRFYPSSLQGTGQNGNIGDTAGFAFVQALEAAIPQGKIGIQGERPKRIVMASVRVELYINNKGVNNYDATVLEYLEGMGFIAFKVFP